MVLLDTCAVLWWTLQHPADRVIVATARLRGVPIVTKDTVMRACHHDSVW